MSHKKIMIFAILAVVLVIILSACTPARQLEQAVRTVTVNTPVLEERPVPAELLRPPVPADQLPVFVSKNDPAASSCLTPEAEGRMRLLMIDRESRLDAWEKWGVLP